MMLNVSNSFISRMFICFNLLDCSFIGIETLAPPRTWPRAPKQGRLVGHGVTDNGPNGGRPRAPPEPLKTLYRVSFNPVNNITDNFNTAPIGYL